MLIFPLILIIHIISEETPLNRNVAIANPPSYVSSPLKTILATRDAPIVMTTDMIA